MCWISCSIQHFKSKFTRTTVESSPRPSGSSALNSRKVNPLSPMVAPELHWISSYQNFPQTEVIILDFEMALNIEFRHPLAIPVPKNIHIARILNDFPQLEVAILDFKMVSDIYFRHISSFPSQKYPYCMGFQRSWIAK